MESAETSHPYYWSGFAIIGDGAAAVTKQIAAMRPKYLTREEVPGALTLIGKGDTIYVTNTTDTATINVSNGVSFSEAVAIAAAVFAIAACSGDKNAEPRSEADTKKYESATYQVFRLV